MVIPKNETKGDLRVVVIGVGLMGSLHARAVRATRAAELCGVVDLDPAIARAHADALGVEAFGDLEAALAATDAQAAIVATPDAAHGAPVRLALEHGVAVLVEKPLATSVEEAEALADLARERDVPLMVGHLLRFDPRYDQAAEVLRSGELGSPVFVSVRHWSSRDVGQRVGATTSPLWHFAIHHLDAIHWLTGAVVQSVDGARLVESPGGVSTFGALGTLTNDAAFQLAVGWSVPASGRREAALEIHCDLGTVTLTSPVSGATVATDRGSRDLDPLLWPTVRGELEGLLRREVEHFVAALVDGSPFAVTPQDAVQAVRSAAMLEQAARSRSLA